MNLNVSIIGGAGHIGLPLGLLLKKKGVNVTLIDINKKKTRMVLLEGLYYALEDLRE